MLTAYSFHTREYKRLDCYGEYLATYEWFVDVDPVAIIQRQFIEGQEIVFKAGFTPYNIAHAARNVFFKDKDDRDLILY